MPDRELFDGAMRGMVDVLHRHGDEHSEFLPEEEADPLRSEIRQQFGGIGVRIRLEGEPPRLTIVGPPEPGTPAARANLLPGDQILAIDGQPTDGMKMDEVLQPDARRAGHDGALTIQHEHTKPSREPSSWSAKSSISNRSSATGAATTGSWQFQLAADPRIAHVRIASFGERTAEELDRRA